MRRAGVLFTRGRLALVLLLAAAIAVPVAAGGCGASTPQDAVSNFYKAIEARNWNAYLGSILPDNVRRMTQSDMLEAKKQFQEADFKYTGLKFKTAYDKKDKDKADVELTEGTITGTNPATKKKESTTIAEIKKSYNVTPTIQVQRYRGNWFVAVPMASADKQQQQQPQQQQQQQQ